MGYIKKKVSGNTTSTFNTKTGQTRYTTSNKVGNITNSSSHKGNKTRSTKTTTVGGVVTRTSKSYTPPKMKIPKPAKVKKSSGRYQEFRTTSDVTAGKILLAVFVFFIVISIIGVIV